jgi:glycosyltransferase involved in cell wall biosynthesis
VPKRLAAAVDHGSFAARATQAIRRDRARYDLVYVVGADAWHQDVARVHAVVRAENRRWPDRGGRGFRAARLRARLAPLTWPQNSVERTIQRRQFRSGCFRRLVAVTNEVRRDLQDSYSVPLELVDVLPCPIDSRALADAPIAGVRERIGIGHETPLVLFLGNDFQRKGLDEAVRVLGRSGPDVHMVVVGSGDGSWSHALATRLGIAERVHFEGHVDHPERYMKEADLLLLPTREDVWGTTLIEAMAARLPIVTTSSAGASGVVAEAGAGVVVKNYSTEEFASAVAGLLTDPERRQRAGQRGHAAAAAYDVRALAPTLLSILKRAAAER